MEFSILRAVCRAIDALAGPLMAIGRITMIAIAATLALVGCDRSYSTQEVGYHGYVSKGTTTASAKITPPSSGTSNGTDMAVPVKTK